MRKTPLYGLWILLLLTSAACSSGGSNVDISGKTQEGEACTTPDEMVCGVNLDAKPAILLCSGSDIDGYLWKLVETCEFGCSGQFCLTSPQDILPDLEEDKDTPQPVDTAKDLAPQDTPEEQKDEEAPCTASCEGKICGDDGCGGKCGSCALGEVCVDDGATCCVKQCMGKSCGDDGCGGNCGECWEGEVCNSDFKCGPPCQPKCEQMGWECGPDGCDGDCGECPKGTACGPDHKCSLCAAVCDGKECGDDGCGGLCGSCNFGQTCKDFMCKEDCLPSCQGMQCGPDGCGGNCGFCSGGKSCSGGVCIYLCTPQCQNRVCGTDGCGGLCGTCPGGTACNDLGQCEACVPDCTGRECGSNGCDGLCGECGTGLVCGPTGSCVDPQLGCQGVGSEGACDGHLFLTCEAGVMLSVFDCHQIGKDATCTWLQGISAFGCFDTGTCTPDCTGKNCGPDGCGGSCGTCPLGKVCNGTLGTCQGEGDCGLITSQGCCSGNSVVSCQDEVLVTTDCGTMEEPDQGHCGWNSEASSYGCVAATGSGGDIDLYCPGGCVPHCAGKQCGDDGCGGDCGECPSSLVCENGLCTGGGGGCGAFGQDPVCQGDIVIWCENDRIYFHDCKATSELGYCAWNPDLYVYACLQEECIPDCTEKECGSDGCNYVCGYCPSVKACNDMGKCVYGQGNCGEVTYMGQCVGNTVEWCQNGVLQTFECMNLGPNYTCGWFENGQYYWCVQ